MKNFFFAFFILVMASCTPEQTTLKVKLTTSDETPKANFGLGIVDYNLNHRYYNECDTMLISENGEFEIDLEKGTYTLYMLNPYSDDHYYHIEVNNQKEINLELALMPLSLHQKVEKVSINGEFNNWSNNVFLEFDEVTGTYKIGDKYMDLKIKEFNFKINDKQVLHTNKLPTNEYNKWHQLSNINSKGNSTIIFDPSEYGFIDANTANASKDPSQYNNYLIKPLVKTNKETEENYELLFALQEINNELGTARYELKTRINFEDYVKIYDRNLERFNLLKENANKNSFFVELGYYMAKNFDPVYIEYYDHMVNNRRVEGNKLKKSSSYFNYLKKVAIALKNLLENNENIPIPVLQSISPYYDAELYNYGILDEIDVPFGFFTNFLIDYEKTVSDQEIGGMLLYTKARNTERYNPEKAKKIIETLKETFPNYSGFQNGMVDNLINKFKITEGSIAPDFELMSMGNEEIKLSELKGKYVFLDFWGTWCSPCCAEIPNVKKLSDSFSDENLIVIGISTNDSENVLRSFIKENQMKYINTMSDKKVNKDFGVSSYPSTFLIDKEGKIIAKNLRGGNLTEQVKLLIQ
ncbi:MAG: TlpA disulfide reductase family protein [Prolixibacteraceae bacterium]|jgi:peroxiredoxin|nr:TlpA disulfide reductase family protein [Prolixibacteraceae bacterium]